MVPSEAPDNETNRNTLQLERQGPRSQSVIAVTASNGWRLGNSGSFLNWGHLTGMSAGLLGGPELAF